MVEIMPFRGWYYNKEKVDVRLVVAPPHDVISKEEQDELYKRSKYNIVRALLPKEGCEVAKKTLDSFILEGVLISDERPAYYVYEQEFDQHGKRVKRLGFIAAVRADRLGRDVMPHEMIFPDRAEERRRLFKSTKTNLSPIFGLYEDKKSEIRAILTSAKKSKPLFEFKDPWGVVNRVWPLYDTQHLTELFKDERVIIADGHHRYTAASKLAKTGDKSFAYAFMYLVDLSDPALIILPTHRLLKCKSFDLEAFLERALGLFDISEVSDIWGLESLLACSKKHTFGVHTKEKSYLLKLRDEGVIEHLVDGNNSKEWKHLEISVLNKIILDKMVGPIYEEITYAKHPQDVVDLLKDGSYNVAFLLRPSSVREVTKIVANKELMPHKATYFYPKPLAGLIIRRMEDS